MGQYHLIANLTAMEYIDPRAFGDGPKLTEFGFSGVGAMAGFAALLSTSNNRGFGDLWTDDRGSNYPGHDPAAWLAENKHYPARFDRHVLGRWAGDRVAIVGDYWEADDLADWGDGGPGGYWAAPAGWVNVSRVALIAIGLDVESRDEARRLIAVADEEAQLEINDRDCRAPVVDLPLRGRVVV